MPFSSVLGASSVIKPGVCTSTTRPSVPYTGQLIYETDTASVASWNGSAWVYTHSSGLVLVKSQTIGSAVSSVTVTGAFSATYDNYRIIVSGGSASGSEAIRLQLGSTTTGYYGFLSYGSYSGTSNFGANDNNANYFSFAGAYETAQLVCCFDLLMPFLTEVTEIRSSVRYSTVYGNYVGGLGNSTSYTAFTLMPAGAHTWTGGEIRVYGYKN